MLGEIKGNTSADKYKPMGWGRAGIEEGAVDNELVRNLMEDEEAV